MPKKYLANTKNAAIVGIKNLLYTLKNKEKIIPICIHFGLRKGHNISKLIELNELPSVSLHLDEKTIIRNKEDEKKDLLTIREGYYHHPIQLQDLTFTTTENYLQNLIEEHETLSFIFIPGEDTHHVMHTQLIKNVVDLTLELTISKNILNFKEIEAIIDHLDEHYNRITWARMRDKTANLNLTRKKVVAAYENQQILA